MPEQRRIGVGMTTINGYAQVSITIDDDTYYLNSHEASFIAHEAHLMSLVVNDRNFIDDTKDPTQHREEPKE